ncbi:hypothetical protein Tco_1372655, partial [Tanacetum coccineum]
MPDNVWLNALDNSLVAPEKRLKIKRCNTRIAFTKPQKEETYKVTLEALKLSPCYPAFQITAEVPKIYMHQFWNTIKKIEKTDAYDFKLDKKQCRVDTEVFREILQICPRLPNQDFVELPFEDDLLSFIKELGYSGNCEMLSAIQKFLIKKQEVQEACFSHKLKTVPSFPKEPTQKCNELRDLPKRPLLPPTTSIVIRDTPEAQLKKTLRKSKRETHKLQASGSSKGADFESEVPDEQTDKTKDTSKGTGVELGFSMCLKKTLLTVLMILG